MSVFSIIEQTTLPLPLIAPMAGLLACGATALKPVVGVAILAFAAEIGFVNSHDAHELREVGIAHRSARAMAHIAKLSEAKKSQNTRICRRWARRNARFALKDRVKNLEPRHQWVLVFSKIVPTRR